jgi:hypothetical protein
VFWSSSELEKKSQKMIQQSCGQQKCDEKYFGDPQKNG